MNPNWIRIEDTMQFALINTSCRARRCNELRALKRPSIVHRGLVGPTNYDVFEDSVCVCVLQSLRGRRILLLYCITSLPSLNGGWEGGVGAHFIELGLREVGVTNGVVVASFGITGQAIGGSRWWILFLSPESRASPPGSLLSPVRTYLLAEVKRGRGFAYVPHYLVYVVWRGLNLVAETVRISRSG